MKKLCTFLLASATVFTASAQAWCPVIGTEWWHTYAMIPGQYGHVVTTYTSDTLIEGESWQKLLSVATIQDLTSSSRPIYVQEWPLFTKQVDNTVFLHDRFAPDVVDTLYRFDAQVGDRWSVPFFGVPRTYVVTDVGVRTVDGVELAWWAVDVDTGTGIFLSDTLVERFGFLQQFIYPQRSLAIEPDILELRCYLDAEIDEHFTLDNSCAVVTGVEERGGTEAPVSLFYDGGASELMVQLLGAQNCSYQLLDMRGRIVGQGSLGPGTTVVDTAALPKGMYTLQVVDKQGHRTTMKWIRS